MLVDRETSYAQNTEARGFTKNPRKGLCTQKHTHICTLWSFFLQILRGDSVKPLYREGFAHKEVALYTHFSLFS